MVGADGGDDAEAGGSDQKKGCLVVGSGLKGTYIECSSRGRWMRSLDGRWGSDREARVTKKLW